MHAKLNAYSPVILSILRIVAALLFLEHGLMKLFTFPVAQPEVPSPLPAMLVAAALIETVGGALLALGLFTRVAAFVCSGQMAFAYFIAHAPNSPWPGANGGDAAILFCFLFLYFVFAGGGSLSLDALRKRA
jgi:putative oxidoreductase